jgi:hypothetical protein
VIYGASDGFDRADDATWLGRADSTQAWEGDGSRWGVCGGRACVVAATAGNVANYARLETNLRDLRAAVTISRSRSGSASQAALVMRVAPDWATYILYVGLDATGLVDVWELVAGSWNQISATQTTYDASRERRLEARVVGQRRDARGTVRRHQRRTGRLAALRRLLGRALALEADGSQAVPTAWRPRATDGSVGGRLSRNAGGLGTRS